MEITWSDVWDVCKDILLPETGTLVGSMVLYGILGFVVAVALLALGQKYGAFSRLHKYYNWAVKLYIPLILIGTLYFALQLGLFRGVYKVMDHQTTQLTDGIYGQTVDQIFGDEAAKAAFLETMKASLVVYQGASQQMMDTLKQDILRSDSGYGIVDKVKDNVSAYLIDHFGDEIFSAIIAAVLEQAAKKAGTEVHFSWREPQALMEAVQRVDVDQLEEAIHEKIDEALGHFFHAQYSSARTSTFLMWFLIVLLGPLVEWLIYLKWFKARWEPAPVAPVTWDDRSINAPR